MPKVLPVTSYIPIPNHPRSAETYGKLGDQLQSLGPCPVYLQLHQTWMKRFLWENSDITAEQGDNPAKNTLDYHCVNHQKFETLWAAMNAFPQYDVYAWIDYGIMHVPGVTVDHIAKFLANVSNEHAIAIPGCWPRPDVITNDTPCWRFCGGAFAVPKRYVEPLMMAVKTTAKRHMWRTKKATWEVNTLARVEKEVGPSLPLWWYQADHNETMFTGYKRSTQ